MQSIIAPSYLPARVVAPFQPPVSRDLSEALMFAPTDHVQLDGRNVPATPIAPTPALASPRKWAFAAIGIGVALAGALSMHGVMRPIVHEVPAHVVIVPAAPRPEPPMALPSPILDKPAESQPAERKPVPAAVVAKPHRATPHRPAEAPRAPVVLHESAPEPERVQAEDIEQPAAEAEAEGEKKDKNLLNHIGHGAHEAVDGGAKAGKKIGRGFKKFGKGVGHVFGSAGRELKEGWQDRK